MYQFLPIILAFSAVTYLQNSAQPDFVREARVSNLVDDVVSQLGSLEEAIRARAIDVRLTAWECTTQGNGKGGGNSNKCTGYSRVILDDGLVDPANWESQLVPEYYYLPKWPQGWGFSLIENATSLKACLGFPDTAQNKKISKTILRTYPSQYKASRVCDHDPASTLTSDEVENYSGSTLFIISTMAEK